MAKREEREILKGIADSLANILDETFNNELESLAEDAGVEYLLFPAKSSDQKECDRNFNLVKKWVKNQL